MDIGESVQQIQISLSIQEPTPDGNGSLMDQSSRPTPDDLRTLLMDRASGLKSVVYGLLKLMKIVFLTIGQTRSGHQGERSSFLPTKKSGLDSLNQVITVDFRKTLIKSGLSTLMIF